MTLRLASFRELEADAGGQRGVVSIARFPLAREIETRMCARSVRFDACKLCQLGNIPAYHDARNTTTSRLSHSTLSGESLYNRWESQEPRPGVKSATYQTHETNKQNYICQTFNGVESRAENTRKRGGYVDPPTNQTIREGERERENALIVP